MISHHLNQQTKMLHTSFVIHRGEILNNMAFKKQPKKSKNGSFNEFQLRCILLFLLLNLHNCHGWFSDPISGTRKLLGHGESASTNRHPRYAEFDPPRILPANDFQTVKANTTYTVRCEGSRGVSWRIPATTSSGLISRISISHVESIKNPIGKSRDLSRRAFRNNYRGGKKNLIKNPKKVLEGEKTFVAVLTITQLEFSDTGTFTCTYNGTTDLDSIDNSTSVHLYVDDRNHLLRATSSFDFLHAVQSQTLILPCMPTHPDVNITLWREGTRGLERIFKSPYISYDPKVRYNHLILYLFK